MKNKAERAEVYTLDGKKVCVFADCNRLDLSKLSKDVYIIRYMDKCGNTLQQEKIVLR
ncbi:MAG: hypothetical protein ACPLXM_02490 [Bacteroidales bacterium]|nr:hypothetical protein [Bacteroidales bacterium]HQK36511.1 hypothetical protein [Bacteroidales bacterium]